MTPILARLRWCVQLRAAVGWALCDGTLLPIDQFSTLFSLIGTTYGGDGQSTFALPDLRSRIPLHQGQSTGRALTWSDKSVDPSR